MDKKMINLIVGLVLIAFASVCFYIIFPKWELLYCPASANPNNPFVMSSMYKYNKITGSVWAYNNGKLEKLP